MNMSKHRINLACLLVAVFFVCAVQEASAAASECDYSKEYDNPQTIYVEATGADDQNVINSAIQQIDGTNKTSVFLKEGTYVISGTINMKGTAILEGDKAAIVQLEAHAGWKSKIPLITAPQGSENMEIKCFQIDGNYGNNTSQTADSCYRPLSWTSDFSDCESKTEDRLVGRGYYDMIYFNGGTNLSVHDMYMHDGAGDGYKVTQGRNIKFYDNLVYKTGHDAFYVGNSQYAEAWRNRITCRTNAGVRMENSNYISIHDNVIEAYDHWDAGGAGIEIVKDSRGSLPMNQVQIYNNTLHHTFGPGIHIVASGNYGKEEAVANIHHNIFYETGLNYGIDWVGGIITSGWYELIVENNTFDKVYNYGIAAMISANGVSGSGYVVTARNNIINEMQHRRNSAGGSSGLGGIGIINLVPDTHTINVSYNDFWMNVINDTEGKSITLANNLRADPKFVNETAHDYHLAEGSPAIDAGDPGSDFSHEPDPNGGRIDIGRYGNTTEAGTGHTGVAAGINPDSTSDGTGSGSMTSNYNGGASGTGGAGDEKKDIPAYWDPGKALTDPSSTVAITPELSPEEKALQDLYGPLGETPASSTGACTAIEGPGGLIPCGRNTDSSETPWNECDECDLCGIVLMGQLNIELLVKIAGVIATLMIIIAGFLYIFAAGQMALIAQAKLILRYTILGFIVIFAAWAIVDTLLILLGYIDPIEGEWYTIC